MWSNDGLSKGGADLWNISNHTATMPSGSNRSAERAANRYTVFEVYEVSTPHNLDVLDRLEGNGRLYQRELVPINLPDGRTIQAWIYLYLRGTEGLTEIKGGEWKASDE